MKSAAMLSHADFLALYGLALPSPCAAPMVALPSGPWLDGACRVVLHEYYVCPACDVFYTTCGDGAVLCRPQPFSPNVRVRRKGT